MSRHLALPILALVLTVVATAQETSVSDFHAKREALRRRYLEAGSPAEKEAILEEFRTLDLETRKAGGPESAPAPAGEPGAIETALREGLSSQTDGARTRAIDPAPSLGSAADRKPDPRVARLDALIAWSEFELSESEKISKEDLPPDARTEAARYLGNLEVLPDYIEAGRADLRTLRRGEEPASGWGALSVPDWEDVLASTGSLRQHLADRVYLRTTRELERLAERLDSQSARLRGKLRSLERLREAVSTAASFDEAFDALMTVKTFAGSVDRLLTMLRDPSHIPAQALGTAADLAGHPIDLALEALADRLSRAYVDAKLLEESTRHQEVWEDLGDAARSVRETVDRIGELAGWTESALRRAALYRAIWSAPRFMPSR